MIKRFFIINLYWLIPFIFIIVSLRIGAYEISFEDIVKLLIAKINNCAYDEIINGVIFEVRLPRIISVVLVASALSVSGAIFQAIFRNPLADPYTLGVSNGAGFGASLAIVLSLGFILTQLSAVAFAILAVLLTFVFSFFGKNLSINLILSGMLISALFSSLLAFIKFIADPFDKLPEIVYWLMGTFSGSSYEKISYILPIYLIVFVFIYLYRYKINVLSMGDLQAQIFGVNARRDKIIIILLCTILTALAVSMCGIIGWVGIVVPHIVRILVGVDFRKIFPLSISIGICYLLLIDNICRSISVLEIPIGVVTGLLGLPLFLYFIYQKRFEYNAFRA
ncbi:FecCD family ABC transporter permease [Campylobacter sp. RM16704]|uniref:FecCD family ABC transporter permease n=1 Tax=Campylobacter sp. RM16704 TaxID=1500960 RepID=UPI000581FD24|nr:iron ABC transporter permease [Campylobacter sp. RM16704]AJC86338.1 iron siderophore ABC transporter, permease protein [Campylobacter sp. RM16704]